MSAADGCEVEVDELLAHGGHELGVEVVFGFDDDLCDVAGDGDGCGGEVDACSKASSRGAVDLEFAVDEQASGRATARSGGLICLCWWGGVGVVWVRCWGGALVSFGLRGSGGLVSLVR